MHQPLALTTDFGHSPIGRLGENRVRTERTIPQKIQRAFAKAGKAITSRIAKQSMTTQMRADAKHNKALMKTSKQVGEMLGALSKTDTHKVDSQRFMRLFTGLAETAAPITDRGVELLHVIQTRLSVNVPKMTTQQLVALKRGIMQALENDDINDVDAKALIRNLEPHVNAELRLRMHPEAQEVLRPIFEQAAERVPRFETNARAVDSVFDPSISRATDLLRKYGMLEGVNAHSENALGRALVKDVIESVLQEGGPPATNVRNVLNCVASRTLYELAHTNADIGTGVPNLTNQAIQNSITRRMDNAQQGFMEASQVLGRHHLVPQDDPTGPLHAPIEFAREVIELAKHLDVLQKHGDIHGLPVKDEVDHALSNIVERLNVLMRPDSLLLQEYSNQMLSRLSKACQTLGVGAPAKAIAEEITRRKKITFDNYGDKLRLLADASSTGDTSAILNAVVNLKAAADDALLRFQELGDKIDDREQIVAFRARILSDAIDGLSEDESFALQGLLTSYEGRALTGGMSYVGYTLMQPPSGFAPTEQQNAKGTVLIDIANEMELIRQLNNEALQLRGINLPILPDSEIPEQEALSPKSRQAICDVFGVQIHPKSGVHIFSDLAPKSMQDMVKDSLAEPLKEHESSAYKLNTGLSLNIAPGMVADLPRARFNLIDSEGNSTPMLDVNRFNQAHKDTGLQNQLLLMASDRLVDFCGGDTDMALFVSSYVHQGILAGMQKANVAGKGPILLPDGTPGQFMGKENSTYSLRKGENGEIIVKVDYTLTDATMHMDFMSGNATMLDPENSSCAFSYEVTLTPDRQVSLSSLVSFDYRVALQPPQL